MPGLSPLQRQFEFALGVINGEVQANLRETSGPAPPNSPAQALWALYMMRLQTSCLEFCFAGKLRRRWAMLGGPLLKIHNSEAVCLAFLAAEHIWLWSRPRNSAMYISQGHSPFGWLSFKREPFSKKNEPGHHWATGTDANNCHIFSELSIWAKLLKQGIRLTKVRILRLRCSSRLC